MAKIGPDVIDYRMTSGPIFAIDTPPYDLFSRSSACLPSLEVRRPEELSLCHWPIARNASQSLLFQ